MNDSGSIPAGDRRDELLSDKVTENAADGGQFILSGGKVDGEAVRQAYIDAREQGDDGFVVTIGFEMMRDVKDRLDRYLTSRVTFMSRSKLQNLIDSGGAKVNGRTAKSSTKLRLGDRISLVIPQPASGEIEADDIPLDVLYEDEYILVINKQPDIIVHPARAENRGTMLNALVHHFGKTESGELSSVGEEFARPGVVHRLDRNTSGCIVFAKSDEAHWKMGQRFQDRKVDKRYLALVQGWVEPDMQLIDLPLGPHLSRAKGSREKRVVRYDDLGKASKTVCRVRERYELPPIGKKHEPRKYSLVELELLTGRTHQIRVHLSHIGYPIVGDDMYKGKSFVNSEGQTLLDRQALHAALLAFDHPMSDDPIRFIAPLRDEFASLIAHLRKIGQPQIVEVLGVVSMRSLGLG
ncbi:MAG: RluA family pseudouridine synthase [Phycisphaerales bacterium]|nr:RluA family pseudouridine synthase [Phycisphaerales bacterium]